MKNTTSSTLRILPAALCLVLALLANTAKGQPTTYYWDINGAADGAGGTTPSGSWEAATWTTDPLGTSATGNWVEGNYPVFSAGTDATGAYTITAGSDHTVAGIYAQTGTVTINSPANVLHIPSGMQGFDGALTINAVLADVGGVSRTTGTVNLNAPNTFSGGVSLVGKVSTYFNNNTSFGAGTITPSANNGFPVLQPSGGAPLTINNNFYWNTVPSGFAGLYFVPAASTPLTCTGNWDLEQNFELRNSDPGTAPLTLSGIISGPGGLALGANASIANITSTTVLSGNNTYTGKTGITNQMNNNALAVSVSSFNSVHGGSPLLASSSLGAPTTVANGTISIGFNSNTNMLIYTGAGETTDRVIDFTGTARGPWIQADGTGPLVFTSDFTVSVGGASANTKSLTLQGSYVGSPGSYNMIAGKIPNFDGTHQVALTKDGVGTWVLSGVNTFSGSPLNIFAGTLVIGGAGSLNSGSYGGSIVNNGTFNWASTLSGVQTLSGAITGTGGITVTKSANLGGSKLTLSSTANTFSGKITVTTGILEFSADSNLGTATGSDAITLDNSCTGVNFYYLRCTGTTSLSSTRGITLGSSGGAIGASSGKVLTVNGPITGNGALWASPTGGAAIGQVTLANTGNNYSGGTYITAGTLNLGADNTLPSGTPLTIAASSGTDWFNMQGHNQTIGTLTSSTSTQYGTGTAGTPNLQLSTSGSPANTLTIIQTANTAFNGIITGTGGGITLDATSTSTLSLGGANTYSGPTIVNGGTLEINKAGGLANSTPLTVANGGVLKLDYNTALKSTATLNLADSPAASTVNLNLSGGTQTIGALNFGATSKAQGTWGVSGAQHNNAAFTGSGFLNVTAGGASPTTAITSITPSPVCAGSTVSLTATVSGGNSPSGSVQFFDGATSLGTQPLSGGTATLTGVSLSTGAHSNITAKYLGDDNNNPSTSSPGSVTVNVCQSSVTIDSIVSNPDGSITIHYTGGAGASFTLMKTSDVTLPRGNWTAVTPNKTSTPDSFTITPAGNEFYAIRSN